MDIKSIAVIGAGTMGNGIAHVCARSGFNVVLCDVEQSVLDRAVTTIGKNMDREIAKNKLTAEQKATALGRIKSSTGLEALSGADFVIEAVSEDFSVKSRVFEQADRMTRPDVILASNTSSISITKIAAKTRRSDKVIGVHFMNPVPVIELVELIRGPATTDVTFQTTESLCERLGKTPVEVQDYPGFVSNRVLMPMINEAVYCVMEGVATPEAIDKVMKLGMNHPIGPLALADLIGLDVCLAIMEVLHHGLGDSKYRPCPLLRKMVDAGHWGRKTGQGFFKY